MNVEILPYLVALMFTCFLALFFGAVVLVTIFASIVPWDIALGVFILFLWLLSYLPDNDRQASYRR